MSLRQEFSEYVRACFTGVWVESFEHPEALMEISQLCREENWQLATWDSESGLSTGSGSEAGSASDPVSTIRVAASLARVSARSYWG